MQTFLIELVSTLCLQRLAHFRILINFYMQFTILLLLSVRITRSKFLIISKKISLFYSMIVADEPGSNYSLNQQFKPFEYMYIRYFSHVIIQINGKRIWFRLKVSKTLFSSMKHNRMILISQLLLRWKTVETSLIFQPSNIDRYKRKACPNHLK